MGKNRAWFQLYSLEVPQESFSKPPPIILPYPLGKAIEAGKEDYLEQNSYCQFVGG